MRGSNQAPVGKRDEQRLQRALRRQIERRRFSPDNVVHHFQVLAASELAGAIRAQQHDHVARLLETAVHDAIRVLEEADDADDRRGMDRAAVRLVVEADVAAGNRHAKGAACRADALNRLRELPHDRRPLGVAEVQAVGRAERPCAGARDVARSLRHRQHRAVIRVEIAVASVAVHRHRERAIGALDPHHACALSRQVDRVGAHHVIVLTIDPLLAGDGR